MSDPTVTERNWCFVHDFQAGPRGFCWAAVSQYQPEPCVVTRVRLVPVSSSQELVERVAVELDGSRAERLDAARRVLEAIGGRTPMTPIGGVHGHEHCGCWPYGPCCDCGAEPPGYRLELRDRIATALFNAIDLPWPTNIPRPHELAVAVVDALMETDDE